MGIEFINSIVIKQNCVYITSKSSNDNLPYRTRKIDSLTMIFQNEGQEGLDREIIQMLCEYAKIKGNHQSMRRYIPCLMNDDKNNLIETLNYEFHKLSDKDKISIHRPKEQQTLNAKRYKVFESKAYYNYYTQLASLVDTIQ